MIYKSPQYFLPSFESVGLYIQEKKFKIDFQDGSHPGFLIKMILAIFFSSTSHPDISYQVLNKWPLGSGEEAQNIFSIWPPWGHLRFLIQAIFATFDLQVTLILPTKFCIKWPAC